MLKLVLAVVAILFSLLVLLGVHTDNFSDVKLLAVGLLAAAVALVVP